MFALHTLQVFFSTSCTHTHGFRFVLLSLNASKYHLELGILIIFIYLNAQMHIL